MIISIASGKGGTGKTTVAVNMCLSCEGVQLLDCDVEEPNDHLLLQPEIEMVSPVFVQVPEVDLDKCDFCGKCAEFCGFNALFVAKKKVMFFPELCHSCGGCVMVCPKKAIREKKRKIGQVKKGVGRGVDLAFGELTVGEPMATPVIREVKQLAKKGCNAIVDSPPGAACPVVESVYGSDFCLLVTEPTPFGLHDLKIAVEVIEKLKIPLGVVVNQSGIGDRQVYKYCEEKEIPMLMEIPYSRKIAELYSSGVPFVEEMPEWKEKFRELYNAVEEKVAR
jgi:MinD superfamily P-loop ATPase